jgi:hypothetical protein
MGMQDPMQVAKRMRGDMLTEGTVPPVAPLSASGDALGDNAIANNLRQQAMRMSAEAKGLLAEADRLLQEANTMDPVSIATTAPKTRGRPKKVLVKA